MVKRLFITTLLACVLGTLGLVLVPQAGLLAGPMVCAGSLEITNRGQGLHYTCVTAGGQLVPVPAEQVIMYTIPLLALALAVPVHKVLVAAEARATRARGAMRADLESAIGARAEILRVGRSLSLRRQAVIKAAELRLVLWVQPPNGRPYEAQVAWLVEDENLPRIRVGAVLPVRVNPRRPEHVYPAQPWAHYAWWKVGS